MLISFDGLDSSGKATQVVRLCDRLKKEGREVLQVDTPDYSTPSGRELKERLQGKLGNWREISWQEKMGYFANNRAEHKQEVLDTLGRGGVVVYDRYIPSSLIFMAAEAGAAATREEVFKAVEELEYGQNGMPRETVSIFLDVPPRVALKLLSGRKQILGDEDEYTDDIAVQERLYERYLRLSEEQPERVVRIACMDGDRLRSPDEIEALVWEVVSSHANS